MEETPSFGKFFQIGYVTRNIDAALEQLTNVLGARQLDLHRDYRDSQGNPILVHHLSHLDLGGIEVELIEPRLDWPSSIYLEALPNDGIPYAVHHFGFCVDSDAAFDAAMGIVEKAAFQVPFAGNAADLRFAYVDTRPISGHYTEIVYFHARRQSRR